MVLEFVLKVGRIKKCLSLAVTPPVMPGSAPASRRGSFLSSVRSVLRKAGVRHDNLRLLRRLLEISPKSQKGYTILELIVAIALTVAAIGMAFSVYISFNRAVLRKQARGQFNFEAGEFSRAVKEQVLNCRGLTSLAEDRLAMISRLGKRIEYLYESGELLINGKPFPAQVEEFKIEALGPVAFSADAFSAPQYPYSLFAGLDGDGDGYIDLLELDKDGSGVVEGRECAWVGLLKITLRYVKDNQSEVHVIQVHPRNRMAARDLDDEGFEY